MHHRISGKVAFIIWFGIVGGGLSAQTTTQPEVPPTSAKDDQPGEQATIVDPDDAIRKAIQSLESIDTDQDEEQNGRFFEQATTYIQQARKADPSHPRLPFVRGWAFVKAGRNRLARAELQNFVETRAGRNEWRAFLLLGDLFVDQYPQLAKAQYEKAAVLKPGESGITFGLARAASFLGNASDAVELARTAVRLDGRSDVSYVGFLADALTANGQWDEAEREAKSAIALASRNANRRTGRRTPLVVLDNQYKRLIQINQAKIGAMEGATSNFLTIAKTIRLRAGVAQKLVLHEIHAVLEQAVELAGDAAPLELLQQYGAALADIERKDEAIGVFERILALDPDNAEAKSRIQELRPIDVEPPG